ncbi:AAA family ATPase [Kitasatospora sp. NBC_01287]|uniref:adenylate/guanylate cyclase domain-containing protein n=1 Tax=Kitasatospora sp. NBC_01287 TaxID=2903573 RepID=UPI00224EA8E7|nr:adenylate/guanylate cyclase domain-containing protein [Kitasatospora sp. NBC_01287]MCX4744428.1 AAA family ATPase [Kitasatospora sp. NBC_01287]
MSATPAMGSTGSMGSIAAPTRAEERKVVTVVFCDLVGSTALSGRLDPEALRSVTLRYFELMSSQLLAHGGTVEKFIGDAVMAVFGIPAMHEDDARRALAATLDMLAALEELNAGLISSLGVRLDVRIGVNTGEAVANTEAGARQALVSGEVVNVAARLEQHAAAGQILIGPQTLRSAGACAVVDEVGLLELKGKAERVRAYRLLGLRGDEPELMRRFDTPFVGRERELAELDDSFARARTGPGAQLVTVYAEAGMGKTRLVREWLAGLGSGAALIGSGRCRPYGERGSLAPLADALRQLLADPRREPHPREGTHPDSCSDSCSDSHPDSRSDSHQVSHSDSHPASHPGLARLFGTDGSAASLALLRTGLLLDGTPTPSVEDTGAALADVLSALARRQPLVLVLDDVHWAGRLLREALERLVADLAGAPVLVLCVARLELLENSPDWGTGQEHAKTLVLDALTPRESLRLAAGLVEVAGHGDTVAGQLLDRAEGNPLHLEHLLAMVAEQRDPTELPPTVQALLGARIDALVGPERTALSLASVVGREFGTDELTDLARSGPEGAQGGELAPDTCGLDTVRPALRGLGGRRLIEPARRPVDGEALYRFSSGLVQEVSYQSMAKRIRAERHERVADLLIGRGAPDSVIGGHLAKAHRYRGELGLLDQHTGALRLRAGEHLTRGGEHALSRADLAWAEELLGQAVGLCHPGERPWLTAAWRLAEVQLATGRTEQGRALLEQVLAVAEQPDAARATVTAEATATATAEATATATATAEATPEATTTATTVATVATVATATVAAHVRLALAVLDPGGDLRQVATTARAELPHFDATGDSLGIARCCLRIAQEQQLLGRHGTAQRLLDRALEHAVLADAEPERAAALGAVGVSLWVGPTPVPEAVERCRALLAEHGRNRRAVQVTLNCPLAVLYALGERLPEARACLAAARRTADELGYAEAAVFLPVFGAAVEQLADRPGRAVALLRRADRACRELGATVLLGTIARDLARALLAAGRTEECAALPNSPAGTADRLPCSDAADLYGTLARLRASCGPATAAEEAAAATALAERALAEAASTDSPVVRATAALDQAHTELLLGRPGPATRAAARAGHLFAAKGHLVGVRWAEALAARAARAAPAATDPTLTTPPNPDQEGLTR